MTLWHARLWFNKSSLEEMNEQVVDWLAENQSKI